MLQFWVVCFLARPLQGRGLQSGVGQQSCGRVCCVERLKVSKVYISKGRDWLKVSKIMKEINRGQNSFASMPLKILTNKWLGVSSDDLSYEHEQSGKEILNKKQNIEKLNDMLFNQMKMLMSIVWHFVLMMGFLLQLVENGIWLFLGIHIIHFTRLCGSHRTQTT